jgi:hypothetical protein
MTEIKWCNKVQEALSEKSWCAYKSGSFVSHTYGLRVRLRAGAGRDSSTNSHSQSNTCSDAHCHGQTHTRTD